MTASGTERPSAPGSGRLAFRSRRPLTYVAGTLVVGLLGAWAVWMTMAGHTGVASQLRYSDVHSDRAVTVHFEVAKDAGTAAACDVLATGTDGRAVGRDTVTVPAKTERVVLSHRLSTSERAAKIQVGDCRLITAG